MELGSLIRPDRVRPQARPLAGRRGKETALGIVLATALVLIAFFLAFTIGSASRAPAAKPEPLKAGRSASELAVTGLVATPAVQPLRVAPKARSHRRAASSKRAKRSRRRARG